MDGGNGARLGSRTHINAETRRRRKKVNKRTAVTVRSQMSKIVSDDFSLVFFFFFFFFPLLIPELRLTKIFQRGFSIPRSIEYPEIPDRSGRTAFHGKIVDPRSASPLPPPLPHTIEYSRRDHVPTFHPSQYPTIREFRFHRTARICVFSRICCTSSWKIVTSAIFPRSSSMCV